MASGTKQSKIAQALALAQRINKNKGFGAAKQQPLLASNMEEVVQTQFEEEIEINDFPQNARFKVTQKVIDVL